MIMVKPPAIQSIGAPNERHASRVVAEMARWLVDERARLEVEMQRAMRSTKSTLGNPIAQRRFVERLRKAGGSAILDLQLTPGKRGRFSFIITDWGVYDPFTGRSATPGDPLPEKLWLECTSFMMDFDPRVDKETTGGRVFLVTHHAMQRLAERCDARTTADLIAAMRELWQAIWEETGKPGELPDLWYVPVSGGKAVLERGERGIWIVKTILSSEMKL